MSSVVAPPATVDVILGLDRDEVPFAKPQSAEAWRRAGGGDLVRYQSRNTFTVRFRNGSPFTGDVLDGVPSNGTYVAEDRIRDDAELRSYKYDLTVDGKPIDPEIVVKQDPT